MTFHLDDMPYGKNCLQMANRTKDVDVNFRIMDNDCLQVRQTVADTEQSRVACNEAFLYDEWSMVGQINYHQETMGENTTNNSDILNGHNQHEVSLRLVVRMSF